MKKIFFVFILFLFLNPAYSLNKVFAKEITNIQWKKSVAKGKKLFNFRETVTSPALGKKAWKITLLPKDCGRDNDGNYSDCKNNGKDAVVGHGGGDRARSEYSSSSKMFTGEKWMSVSIFIPQDFKSVEPVSTSLFQIYEWGKTNQQRHPRMMLRVKRGNLEPRYFAVNGMDSPGLVKKDLKIDDMRGKWTTIIFHTNMTKDPLKGFVKMYVNGELYNDYEGRTGYGGKFYNKFGIYHSWISRWTEVYGEYPTQVVYYDNLFRTNSKKKLLKLIQN